MSDTNRVAAEILGVPWEKVDLAWGDTSRGLPWTCVSGGSQTTHAMTRAAHAAASDAKRKLQEIAARDLGGRPDDYVLANERVFRRGGGGMSLAQAAHARHRARRQVRRPRAARGHQQRHQAVRARRSPGRG